MFFSGTKNPFHSLVLLEYITNANSSADKRKMEATLSRCYLLKNAPQWRSRTSLHLNFLNLTHVDQKLPSIFAL
jgi:hypothetical protein